MLDGSVLVKVNFDDPSVSDKIRDRLGSVRARVPVAYANGVPALTIVVQMRPTDRSRDLFGVCSGLVGSLHVDQLRVDGRKALHVRGSADSYRVRPLHRQVHA